MNRQQLKREKRIRRHARVRSVVSGTASRPRLAVFKSLTGIYSQLIDDESGTTLAAASTREIKGKQNKTDAAAEVGKMVAEKAKAKGIADVVFDRGGYLYHGRVKALAEAAREAGLNF